MLRLAGSWNGQGIEVDPNSIDSIVDGLIQLHQSLIQPEQVAARQNWAAAYLSGAALQLSAMIDELPELMVKLSIIIIPTLGRKQELFNTINDLSRQMLPKESWELIVILQNQPDLEAFKSQNTKWGIQLKVVFSPAPNASLARNIGLLESKGEIVLFMDDDLEIKNQAFLSHHLAAYENQKISGVFGQVTDPGVPPRTTRHKWSHKKHIGWMFFPPNYSIQTFVDCGSSNNLSVKKDFALKVGGMDDLFEKGAHREESDFCLRLTRQFGKILFEPKATVVHLGAAQGGCRNWVKNDGVNPFTMFLENGILF